jgi:hypothetical protein
MLRPCGRLGMFVPSWQGCQQSERDDMVAICERDEHSAHLQIDGTKDAARDAFVSRFRGKLQQLFDTMDTDGSGFLDPDELVAGISQIGPRSGVAPTAAEVAEAMADFDKDQVTV